MQQLTSGLLEQQYHVVIMFPYVCVYIYIQDITEVVLIYQFHFSVKEEYRET